MIYLPVLLDCSSLIKQEEIDIEEDQLESKSATSLPVLCIEHGSAILKFSEVFGVQEPVRKAKTDHHKRPVSKGIQQAHYKKLI